MDVEPYVELLKQFEETAETLDCDTQVFVDKKIRVIYVDKTEEIKEAGQALRQRQRRLRWIRRTKDCFFKRRRCRRQQTNNQINDLKPCVLDAKGLKSIDLCPRCLKQLDAIKSFRSFNVVTYILTVDCNYCNQIILIKNAFT